MNGTNYLRNANDQILVMVQIETPEGVANIEEICSVNGLDGIFVGPMDLSCSMGHFANPSAPQVQEAIHKIEAVTMKSDKFLATVAGDMQAAKVLYDRGYQLVVPLSDSVGLGKLAMNTVDTFHEMFPNR